MRKQVLQILAMLFVVCPTIALAQAPKDGVYISDEDIKAVLKHAADTHRTIPDNSIRVIDMDKYQLGVAVVNRGAMGSAAPANANAAGGGNAAPATRVRRAAAWCDGSEWNLPRRYRRKLCGHIGRRNSDHRRHDRQWKTFRSDRRSNHGSQRSVLRRHDGGIHKPSNKSGRRDHYPRACAARILSHPRSYYVPEHTAGLEKGSEAWVRESSAKVDGLGQEFTKCAIVL